MRRSSHVINLTEFRAFYWRVVTTRPTAAALRAVKPTRRCVGMIYITQLFVYAIAFDLMTEFLYEFIVDFI